MKRDIRLCTQAEGHARREMPIPCFAAIRKTRRAAPAISMAPPPVSSLLTCRLQVHPTYCSMPKHTRQDADFPKAGKDHP